jgi:tripartite-type tricarboxylate transporter receptor subunit TctC
MKLRRRQFLRLAVGAAALQVVSRTTTAQSYPARSVRMIVGFPPGGAADTTARIICQWLSEHLGQTFIIENRPGAAGNIATEAAVRAPADGYTLLLVTTNNTVNATLYDKLNFVFLRDIAPVANVIRFPCVLDVNPSVPVTTVPELIAYAKANRGKLNMGSSGIGSAQHVSGELFKMMTGVDLVHVPYRGGALAVADLLAGQVQVVFDALPESIGHIRAGKLRSLAVTTATRSDALPDVPTMSDFVPGYEASFWQGVGVLRNTPAAIIDRLNNEINAALADPKLGARFADLGAKVLPGSTADFAKLIAEDTEKWAKVVKFAGIVIRASRPDIP